MGEGPIGQVRVGLSPFVTVIPIQESSYPALMATMYTSRFVVKNGMRLPGKLKVLVCMLVAQRFLVFLTVFTNSIMEKPMRLAGPVFRRVAGRPSPL